MVNSRRGFLAAAWEERERRIVQSGSGPGKSLHELVVILMEEVGEVAKSANALRAYEVAAEVVQVAACAMAVYERAMGIAGIPEGEVL